MYTEIQCDSRHVYSFWFNNTIPTVDKIFTVIKNDDSLPVIYKSNLHRLLKYMDFETKRSRNGALIENDEIVLWRRRYLESIRKFLKEASLLSG